MCFTYHFSVFNNNSPNWYFPFFKGFFSFLGIESFPAHFRSGQMEWVKVGDTASVKALNAEAFNPTALLSNVVVR